LRQSHDLQQNELAARLGEHPVIAFRMEAARRKVTLLDTMNICRALGEPAELLARAMTYLAEPANEAEQAIIDAGPLAVLRAAREDCERIRAARAPRNPRAPIGNLDQITERFERWQSD